MTRAIVFLLLVTACAVPQTSETKEDSVAVLSGDTLAVDGIAEEATDEMEPYDTVFNTLELDKKFDKPQIDPGIGYVYNYSGLDVYETNVATNTAGHVDYKTKLKLLDGLHGEYVAIEFNGKTGFVLKDQVLNLPVPETKDVVEYFVKTLQLTKPVVERTSKPDAEDGSFLLANYTFENGFKIFRHEYYEGGGTEVTLPGLSAQQAFLFASYFYESFGKSFEEFPTKARDEDLPEEKHITVSVENGKVTVILVGNGEGCYWEDSISGIDGGMLMSSQGGC